MLGEIIGKLLNLFRPSQNRTSSPSNATNFSGDAVVEWMIEEFRKLEGNDLQKDHHAMKRLAEAAAKAKSDLATAQETTISLPFITADSTGPKHLKLNLTRAKLNELTGQ